MSKPLTPEQKAARAAKRAEKKDTAPKVEKKAPEKPKQTEYVSLKDKKPDLVRNGHIYNTSGLVLLKTKKGRVVPGYVYEHVDDYEYFGSTAKKGDTFGSTELGETLLDLDAWMDLPE